MTTHQYLLKFPSTIECGYGAAEKDLNGVGAKLAAKGHFNSGPLGYPLPACQSTKRQSDSYANHKTVGNEGRPTLTCYTRSKGPPVCPRQWNTSERSWIGPAGPDALVKTR